MDNEWEDVNNDWEDVSSQPVQATQSPGNEHQNILGQTFNVPAAAIRSAIKGTGYAKGATNPSSISTFQEDAANKASDLASRLPRPLVGPAAFVGSSIGQLAGLVADSVTNPADLLATIVGGKAVTAVAKTGVGKAIGEILTKKRYLGDTPNQLIEKANKLTTEILNPAKDELATANIKGKTLPAISNASNVIKKAKDGEELLGQFKTAVKDNIEERNAILKSDNYKVDTSHINVLEQKIAEAEKLGHNSREIMQMKQVLGEEKAFYIKNGGQFDRLAAQDRKEYFQNLTDSLLNKRSKGVSIDLQPGRTKALDILRGGLKEAVEGGDKKVRDLNSTYGGLLRAQRLISEQNALTQKAVKENLFQRIVHLATNPKDATFQALQRAQGLESKTSRIEKLMTKANSQINKGDILAQEYKNGRISSSVTPGRWRDIVSEAKEFKKNKTK